LSCVANTQQQQRQFATSSSSDLTISDCFPSFSFHAKSPDLTGYIWKIIFLFPVKFSGGILLLLVASKKEKKGAPPTNPKGKKIKIKKSRAVIVCVPEIVV
jgi:hypothetical protein